MLDTVNAVLDTVLPAEVEPNLLQVMVAAPADAPPVATEPPAAASVPQNLGGSGSETTTAVELTVPSPADTVPEKTQEPVSSDEPGRQTGQAAATTGALGCGAPQARQQEARQQVRARYARGVR